MNWLLILPLLLPLSSGTILLLGLRSARLQRWISVIGTAGLLASSLGLLASVWQHGIQAVQMGAWPAPFGITLVADLFSALMVVLTGVMGFAVVIYSLGSIDDRRESFGYYPLLQLLFMGVCGAFLTGDIFNLYVWFEVMLVASFVLLALGGERSQLEGSVKYVTLNLIGSTFFLSGVGVLYGMTGTLNMADLSGRLQAMPQTDLITALAMLFLIAFGLKAAVFPLFFWLPASYHTPPVAVTAIFAALLTKVGVYVLIRVFTLLFVQDVPYTHTLILVLAGFTMVTGVLGAVAQTEMRRLLSFHIVSQIGYLLMGLGIHTRLALAGAIFFMAHVILSKSALFLVSGIAHRLMGTYDLKELGGLYRHSPLLAVLFLVPALSLAGLPPLSGFFAKLILVRAGLEAHQYVIVATALGVSILTLFSMIKIWTEAFWKPGVVSARGPGLTGLLVGPTALAAALIVSMGLFAQPLFTLALRAADQLLDSAGYVHAVLGTSP
jgi:multicomponent Na+:H+ antiporter subunit D